MSNHPFDVPLSTQSSYFKVLLEENFLCYFPSREAVSDAEKK